MASGSGRGGGGGRKGRTKAKERRMFRRDGRKNVHATRGRKATSNFFSDLPF